MELAAVIAAVVKMESIRMEFVCRTVLSIFMSKGHDSYASPIA